MIFGWFIFTGQYGRKLFPPIRSHHKLAHIILLTLILYIYIGIVIGIPVCVYVV